MLDHPLTISLPYWMILHVHVSTFSMPLIYTKILPSSILSKHSRNSDNMYFLIETSQL
jgi:hypothetical protein